MNVLDESIVQGQRQRLEGGRIRVRQIGVELGRLSMTDEEIIPLLHQLRSVTFFTRDRDYYRRQWCHTSYCLVHLMWTRNIRRRTFAVFSGTLLFSSWADRKGKVVRVRPNGIWVWRTHAQTEETIRWRT